MLQEIAGCTSETAVGIDVLISHIEQNKKLKLKNIDQCLDFREGVPCAIVGGAPSLKKFLNQLKHYPMVFACGSVHDYLVENGVTPDYCLVCDQDELVLNYLRKANENTIYLVASQCHPKVFEYLKNYNTYIWHAYGDKFDKAVFGEGETLIGGGCTVGTRGIVMAVSFGYTNLHIYGMDSSLTDDYQHHSYSFSTSSETIGNIKEIKLGGEDSPTFKVADYMLGQIFDIKNILRIYAHRIQVRVFGDGALSYLMHLANKEANKEV